MPFDPDFPPHEAELISAEFRDQFNALKALIDAQAAQIAELQAALAGTALNPTTVNPLSISLSDPATGPQVQALLDSHNQLLSALLRA